jgi:hypothetical protein
VHVSDLGAGIERLGHASMIAHVRGAHKRGRRSCFKR